MTALRTVATAMPTNILDGLMGYLTNNAATITQTTHTRVATIKGKIVANAELTKGKGWTLQVNPMIVKVK